MHARGRLALIAVAASCGMPAPLRADDAAAKPEVALPHGTAATVQYFPADGFLRGFSVSPPRIARQIPLSRFGRLEPMLPGVTEPFWTLVHWHGVESLADEHRTLFTPRDAAWRNAFQGLHVAMDDDGRPMLTMTIDSLAIYDHEPITYERMGMRRPHFLLSHNFHPDRDGIRRYGGAEARDTTPDSSVFPDFNTFSRLELSMRLRLLEATDLRDMYQGDAPDRRRLHYNRNPFQFWLRVYSRNPRASTHGRFFWLGCRAYDSEAPYRSAIPHENDQIESDGNATFAYKLCDRTVHGPTYAEKLAAFRAGEELTFVIDVLRETRRAVRAIREEKNDFTDVPDDLGGLTLASFNIGWEPASPFRGSMRIRDLSLLGTPKGDAPKP